MRRQMAMTAGFAAAIAGATGACAEAPEAPGGEAPWRSRGELLSLRLDEAAYRIEEGGSRVLRVDAWYAGAGAPVDATALATWSVDDGNVASVDPSGELLGLLRGETRVRATVEGMAAAPSLLEVARGPYSLAIADGAAGIRGKVLDLLLESPDSSFEGSEVELSVDGLLPWGQAREEEPWWGVPGGEPERWAARFLVPPTATVGFHALRFVADGREPEAPLQVDVGGNPEQGPVRSCAYFADDPLSDWTVAGAGDSARSWTLGNLAAGTLYRWAARTDTAGDVDPAVMLWDLAGEVVARNEADPPAGLGEAALEHTALEAENGAWRYFTAAVSEQAAGHLATGAIETDCETLALPEPALVAVEDAEFFGGGDGGGAPILPGGAPSPNLVHFDGSAFADGLVVRAFVWLDVELLQPEATRVLLRAPGGREVELMGSAGEDPPTPDWYADFLPEGGRWLGVLGGPAPFRPTAEEWKGTGGGTGGLAGEAAGGVWELEVRLEAPGDGGTWRGARLWVERGVTPMD